MLEGFRVRALSLFSFFNPSPAAGPLTSPVAIRLDSPASKATLAGWRTSKGYTYLASPVQAELNLTPAMARCVPPFLTLFSHRFSSLTELSGTFIDTNTSMYVFPGCY